jgi:integrase
MLRKKPSTVKDERGMIERHVKPNFGKVRIVDLSRQDVIRVHTAMAKTPFTANRLVALVSHMMSMAMKWGLRPEGQNPCKGVERYKEKPREVYLQKPQIDELFRTLDDGGKFDLFTAAFFKLSVLVGARPSELLGLRWSEVDFGRERLNLSDSKTGAKPVYLSGEAIAIFNTLPRVDGSPWVFPSRDPSKHRTTMRHGWDRLRALLKYENVRPYDMRHTFATTGLTNGVQLHEIKGLLGHKVLATTLRYAHVLDKDVAAAARKIGQAVMA